MKTNKRGSKMIFVVLVSMLVLLFLVAYANSAPSPLDMPNIQGKNIAESIQGRFEGGDKDSLDGQVIFNCKGDQIEITNIFLNSKGVRKSYSYKRTYIIEGNKIAIKAFDGVKTVTFWLASPDEIRGIRDDKKSPVILHRVVKDDAVVSSPLIIDDKSDDVGASSSPSIIPKASLR